MDSTDPGAGSHGFADLLRGWNAQVGGCLPTPAYSPDTVRNFKIRGRFARIHDVLISDVQSVSAAQNSDTPNGIYDYVGLYVIRRGAWMVSDLPDLGSHTMSAGQILVRHFGRNFPFRRLPHTATRTFLFPSAVLKPLLGDRSVVGDAHSAEVRLLVAHSSMICESLHDLGPAGVRAAHSALTELAKAVAVRQVDATEPLLHPALTRAARNLIDSHLADPELSSGMLARELNVSVRTLQRAFTETGESVAGCIRHRRLEEARSALAAPSGRLAVSEIAAHLQFSDSSHFIRAFKKKYGQTPGAYARLQLPGRPR